MSGAAAEESSVDDLRGVGERIEVLLTASSAHGVMARERSEELVRVVADLYGAGLERILDIAYDAGRLDDVLLDALAADDLVASLLMVHGLHPHDVTTRVERALEEVRPYLGTHGGDVELLGVSADGVVRLRLLGSCDGCASSSVTLKLAVEGAVEAAAPEVTGIEVETPAQSPPTGGVIPASALRSRLEAAHETAGGWVAVPDLAMLASGELCGVQVNEMPVVVGRVGSDLYAYRDSCARCAGALSTGVLERRLGAAVGDAVLRCGNCHAHFDVRAAGACLDGDGHLEPLPLLVRDGTPSIAVASVVGRAVSA